jgi:hypothetical protein
MRHARSFICGVFYENGFFKPSFMFSVYAEDGVLPSIDYFKNDFGYAEVPFEEALDILERQAREELSKTIQDEEILKYAVEVWLENQLENLPVYGVIIRT